MIYSSAFLLGFLGSLHCLGMCGGFVLGVARGERYRRHVVAFQVGRLLTYATLGAVIGMVGLSIKTMLPLWGPRLAQGLAGVAMLALGSGLLKPGKGLLPAGWVSTSGKCLLGDGRSESSVLLGVLAGFLPCGLLYAALAGALATGNPVFGGLVMFSFWAGTAPALIWLGWMKGRFAGERGERLASVVTAAIGMATLYKAAFPPAMHSCCH
ncbi:MAG: sulfite exporter TauE/SafE family protein [Candidatus Eremiobacteraeota bacterium]|nr:sulfite exporter TauE/SafE family protein [Candidatus Eremiobacteraeota bacterium]